MHIRWTVAVLTLAAGSAFSEDRTLRGTRPNETSWTVFKKQIDENRGD